MLFRNYIFAIFILFLAYPKGHAQGVLDTIPLYGIEDNYLPVMQSAAKSNNFKGIKIQANDAMSNKYNVSINDYNIVKIVYAEQCKEGFVALCETSSNFKHILFLGDKNGNIMEYLLGDIIMGFYKKEIGDYVLFFVKAYSIDQTRENYIGYFVLPVDKMAWKSTSSCTFIEWKESPTVSFSSPKKVVKDNLIAFQIISNKFYILEKSKEDFRQINKFEFYNGTFKKLD